jgi:phospholipid transport system substrate-binding protein
VTKLASLVIGLTLSIMMGSGLAIEPTPVMGSGLAIEPTPDLILKSVIAETLAIIKQDKGVKSDRLAKFAESNVLPHFDFTLMTRSILGRNFWTQSTPSQKVALTREFRTLTRDTFVAAYTSYQDFEIEFKPFKLAAADNEVTVKTLIRLPGGAEAVPIDFYFHKNPDGWKVFDIDIAGSSMVLARRGEFAPVLRDGGIDAAIKLLSEQNIAKAANR